MVEETNQMKHVFSSSDSIGHLWAHQTQDWAKAGNVSFRGEEFISYNTCVARITAAPNGERVYLLTNHTYSSSTRLHQSIARQAIPSGSHIFHVIPSGSGYLYTAVSDNHKDNLYMWSEDIKSKLEDAAQSREPKKTRLILEAAATIKTATEYAEFFQTPFDVPALPVTESELQAISTEYHAKQQTRRDAAQRAANRRRAARNAYWRMDFEQRQAFNALKNEEKIQQWLGGKSVSLPYGLPTYLRVKGSNVETSRGASFPLSHAKRGLALVKAVMARGEEWHTNGHTCHLGHYQIERITPDGTVYAGCHVVPFSSIERIADVLENLVESEVA
jgi:hypothetical protein